MSAILTRLGPPGKSAFPAACGPGTDHAVQHGPLFDLLIGDGEQIGRHSEAERLCGLARAARQYHDPLLPSDSYRAPSKCAARCCQ
jgi:hypothetical protein